MLAIGQERWPTLQRNANSISIRDSDWVSTGRRNTKYPIENLRCKNDDTVATPAAPATGGSITDNLDCTS